MSKKWTLKVHVALLFLTQPILLLFCGAVVALAVLLRLTQNLTHEIYNLCDIDAKSESRKFEKSICHFLTNRKRPFFRLANKEWGELWIWICHHLVVSPRGSTATLTMLWRNSWSITGQTHEKLTSIC